MNLLNCRGAFLAAFISCFAPQAVAQSEDQLVDAFSGEWFIFEPRFSGNDFPCRIALQSEQQMAEDIRLREVDVDPNCSAPFSDGDLQWLVSDGKIIIRDGASRDVAVLGGNPERLSGDLTGPINAVILERKQGVAYKRQLVSALGKHTCYYIGYSADCAGEAATSAPRLSEGPGTIDVLVDLNVRNQPRRSATVVGTVPRENQITVNLCLTASDGVWCRAGFGEIAGWMAKAAIRDGEWPVITFVQSQ